MALTPEEFNSKYGKTSVGTGGVQPSSYTLPDVKRGGYGQAKEGFRAGLRRFGSGITTGAASFGEKIYGALGFKSVGGFDVTKQGYEPTYNKLKEYEQKTQKNLEDRLGVDGAQTFTTQASGALAQGAGQLTASAINPWLGYTAITAQSMGAGKNAYDTAYSTALANGSSEEQAKKIAKINGTITGAANMADIIPVGKALGLGKDVLSKPGSMLLKDFATRFAGNALTEVATEGGQDFISSLTAKLTYDESAEPLRDALHSALISIPTALVFGGAGEVSNYGAYESARENIAKVFVSEGADPAMADQLAGAILQQQIVTGNKDVSGDVPADLQEGYDAAVDFLAGQQRAIATNPDFQIDQAASDSAYSIIESYDKYTEAANQDAKQNEEKVGGVMMDITERLYKGIKGDTAVKQEWRDTAGKKFEALQNQIEQERQIVLANEKRLARNEAARNRRADIKEAKRIEGLKSEIAKAKARKRYAEKKLKEQEDQAKKDLKNEKARAKYAKKMAERQAFLNEPYVADADLPVIDAGSGRVPSTGLPSIQVGADAPVQAPPGYSYEPINDKIVGLVEKQNKILEDVKKPKEKAVKKAVETKKKGTKGAPPKKSKKAEKVDLTSTKVGDVEITKDAVFTDSKIDKLNKEIEALEAQLANPTMEMAKKADKAFRKMSGLSIETGTDVGEVSNTIGLKVTGGGEVKVSGVASSFQKELFEKKMIDSNFTDITESERMVIKEQEVLADQFIEKSPGYALEVAMGVRNSPKDIIASVVYSAFKRKAVDGNDSEMIDLLMGSKINDQATAAGQFGAGLAAYRSEEDVMSVLANKVKPSRTKLAEKKLKGGQSLESASKKIIKETKADVRKQEKEAAKNARYEDFINEITC